MSAQPVMQLYHVAMCQTICDATSSNVLGIIILGVVVVMNSNS